MKNVNVFIKENVKAISPENIYVAPEIPEKKLNNAIKTFKCEEKLESILALYDITLFGSGKDGIIFTGEQLINRPVFEAPISINYQDIQSAEYIRNVTTNDKGKESVKEFVKLKIEGDRTQCLDGLMDCDYQKLASLLTSIVEDFDDFEEENQLVTLAEMSEALKVAYMKIIINMAFSDDDLVDEREYAEILMLMTRLNLATDSRFNLRSYISNANEKSSLETVENLLAIIDKECVGSHNKSIKISLTKDLVSIYMCVNEGRYENFAFLTEYQEVIGVTDDEIELAILAIQNDLNMLKDDFTDDALKKGMKELGAKAGAVGVPLAAVYLSGSVVGMSAAGLTSGLATLGLGGALGFSSMATGIGVAVLIGVGAYKGIKHLTGANELEKNKRRELMLQEVIKQTQATISLLIEDLNYLTSKFNETASAHDEQQKKLIILMQKITQLTKTSSVLNHKLVENQERVIKLQCPTYLNEGKLRSLTSEPTKKKYFELVMSFYEEVEVSKTIDDEEVKTTKLKIKDKIPTSQLDKLSQVFIALGYFKAGEVIKGAASEAAENAKKKLAGFFS